MLMMLGQAPAKVERCEADAHDAGSGGPASGTAKKLMLMMLGQAPARMDTLGS